MNKSYLVGIIVIAGLVSLVAIFGATNHFMGYYDPNKTIAKNNNNNNNKPTPNPNPNPDPKPNPQPTDKEIDGYKCKTQDCEILKGTSLINNKFLFISDGVDYVVLFDITTKEVVETYKSVSVAGDSYIAKDNNDKYGVINVDNEVSNLFPFEYTIIEYHPKKENFILTKNSSSFVANNVGKVITLTYNAQIIDYNDLYIITRTTSGEYHIFNFNNSTELTEYVNTKRIYIELVQGYVGVVTEDYIYRLFDFRHGETKQLAEYQLPSTTKKFHAVINTKNQLEIYADDNLSKAIDL